MFISRTSKSPHLFFSTCSLRFLTDFSKPLLHSIYLSLKLLRSLRQPLSLPKSRKCSLHSPSRFPNPFSPDRIHIITTTTTPPLASSSLLPSRSISASAACAVRPLDFLDRSSLLSAAPDALMHSLLLLIMELPSLSTTIWSLLVLVLVDMERLCTLLRK